MKKKGVDVLKKAVVYARFSSSSQTEQSIEGQMTVCNDYAKKNGYVIVGEYIDRAISGRSDERPDFQRMIFDAESGGFQYILVYKLDRFTRNRYDSAIYKARLKKFGVAVISCMENIGDNPESILLEALLEASAEYYSIDLSQKVRRGMIETAKKGKVLSGIPPIGYKCIDQHLIPDPETAPHVTWAFKAYADGMQRKEIVAELNRRGLRNHRGGLLSNSSLQCVFRNEKYLGVLDQKGFRFENAHEALIDKDTFDKVQAIAAQNKHYAAKQKADVPYLLTGKLFCGYCGQPMRGISGTGKTGRTWYYYECRGRRRSGCKKQNERKEKLEKFVVQQTAAYILDPDRLKVIAQTVVREYRRSVGVDKVAEAEKNLSRLDMKLNKAAEILLEVPDGGRAAVYAKMEQLTQEREYLELELSKLKVAHRASLTEKMVRDWLKSFCEGDMDDPEFRKRLIELLVNSVYLFDDTMVIYYNVDGGRMVTFEEMQEDLRNNPINETPQNAEKSASGECSYSKRLSGQKRLEYKPPLLFHPGLFGIILKRTS